MSESDSDKSVFPSELPPEVVLALPHQHQREIVILTYRLFSDEKFRYEFWADPAGAISGAGFSADASVVDALHKMDREVIDTLVRDWKEISTRSSAFKWGDGSAPEPRTLTMAALAMAVAFATGMVGAHYMAHHMLERSGRDI